MSIKVSYAIALATVLQDYLPLASYGRMALVIKKATFSSFSF
jgi:hypothetical protein